MNCRLCGESIDSRRVELGYDYCTREGCQRVGMERVPLARVTVNKAADQFVRVDSEVVPERATRSYGAGAFADAPPPAVARRPERKRIPSELQLLRAAEARLDRELQRADEQFGRGEVTAIEMKRVQNAAIDQFNARVSAGNIRYRSLKRKRV